MGADLYKRKTGYEARTFLCAPIISLKGNVIGVLQLSNRINGDTGEIIAFSQTQEDAIKKIADLASAPLEIIAPKEFFIKSAVKSLKHIFQNKAVSFQFYKQIDEMDCGPTCLKMITKYYGKDYSLQFLEINVLLQIKV